MILFPIKTYPWRAFVVLASATVALPVALIGLMLALAAVIPSWLSTLGIAVGIGLLLSINAALTVLAVYITTRNEVTIRDATLHLKGGAFHERVPLDSIIDSRVVSLTNNRYLAHARRENGITLPGFRLGWFRTCYDELVFVIAGSRCQRGVHLRSSRAFSVLLAADNPEALKAALDAPESRQH
ncbi:hypothetical protein HKX42_08405 [Salinisphaera sp. USBA-960]|uniref:hypothetical protein n=1 Tax=Salinisphaera orenii TaxID=856731 RepID=UPI000DBE7C3D|nr:hypothetical protein [Salifodinibacter halophilus]NNC26895.1 hypothetical protein [Salifodinibacter halophilus]